jgi:hypothetical protein
MTNRKSVSIRLAPTPSGLLHGFVLEQLPLQDAVDVDKLVVVGELAFEQAIDLLDISAR